MPSSSLKARWTKHGSTKPITGTIFSESDELIANLIVSAGKLIRNLLRSCQSVISKGGNRMKRNALKAYHRLPLARLRNGDEIQWCTSMSIYRSIVAGENHSLDSPAADVTCFSHRKLVELIFIGNLKLLIQHCVNLDEPVQVDLIETS